MAKSGNQFPRLITSVVGYSEDQFINVCVAWEGPWGESSLKSSIVTLISSDLASNTPAQVDSVSHLAYCLLENIAEFLRYNGALETNWDRDL